MATHIERIKEQYKEVANKYLATFLDMFDWDSDNGFWINDDVFSGMYCYGTYYFIDYIDIMYIVNHNVAEPVFNEWYEYTLWASEFDQPSPNIGAWVHGCPRATKDEMDEIERIYNTTHNDDAFLN